MQLILNLQVRILKYQQLNLNNPWIHGKHIKNPTNLPLRSQWQVLVSPNYCYNIYYYSSSTHSQLKRNEFKDKWNEMEFVVNEWLASIGESWGLWAGGSSAAKKFHSNCFHQFSFHSSCPIAEPTAGSHERDERQLKLFVVFNWINKVKWS